MGKEWLSCCNKRKVTREQILVLTATQHEYLVHEKDKHSKNTHGGKDKDNKKIEKLGMRTYQRKQREWGGKGVTTYHDFPTNQTFIIVL